MCVTDPGSTRFHRYDLRDGMLVEGALFELEGAVSVYYVSPTSFVAALSSVEDGTTRIAAVDVTGSAVYSAPFASDAYVLKLDVAAQRVRVLSSSDIEGTLVRSYDLLQLDAGPSGACILDNASTYVQFYDLSDPARPRRAGRLMSDELGVNWRGTLENPDPYLRPVAVGPGLPRSPLEVSAPRLVFAPLAAFSSST